MPVSRLPDASRYKAVMTENRMYRKQQYMARADVDAEGLLKVPILKSRRSNPTRVETWARIHVVYGMRTVSMYEIN